MKNSIVGLNRNVLVKVSEVKVGEPGMVLQTILGSCVGIVFIWNKKRKYGLAHCLLPESPHYVGEIGARYVDQAIFSLIKLLKIMPSEKDEIEVFLAGGGDMLMQKETPSGVKVGTLNLESARRYLKKFDFKFKELSCSGVIATKLILDCDTGKVSVKSV